MDACAETADLYALLDTVTSDDVETARRVGQQVRQTLQDVPIPEDMVQVIRQQLGPDQAYNDVKTELNGMPAVKSQIQAMIHILNSLLFLVLYWAPLFAAGEMARRLLLRIGRGWADPADLEAVRLGLSGNMVTDMNLVVGDLADTVRRAPQLAAFFDALGNDSQTWLVQAVQIEDSGPFFQEWNLFTEKYGARGASEIDIQALDWYEELLPLLQVIAGYLQKEPGSQRAQHQKLMESRETAVNHLIIQSHHGIFCRLRTRFVKRLIYVIHHGTVLREHHKFMMVQDIRTIQEVLKETAVPLTNTQKLIQPDDIWYLTRPELLAIWDDDALQTAKIVPARRADLVRFQKMTPPKVITSDGETPIVKYHIADVPLGSLIGNPVSAGVVEGRVRVIHDLQKETLKPGEILVAPFTDPGWTSLFINAGGLIIEVGSNLTHGSIVARECGIPAIVGVRDATKSLQTGQRVSMDGNRGIIEIL